MVIANWLNEMDNVLLNDVIMRDLPVRRPRTYRHRPSQLMDTYTEKEIHDRFRFCRRSIEFICDIVDEEILSFVRYLVIE